MNQTCCRSLGVGTWGRIGVLIVLSFTGAGTARGQVVRYEMPSWPALPPEELERWNKQVEKEAENIKKYGLPWPTHFPPQAPPQTKGNPERDITKGVARKVATGWVAILGVCAFLVVIGAGAGLYVRWAPRADPNKLALNDPWVRAELARRKAAAADSPPAAPDANPPRPA